MLMYLLIKLILVIKDLLLLLINAGSMVLTVLILKTQLSIKI